MMMLMTTTMPAKRQVIDLYYISLALSEITPPEKHGGALTCGADDGGEHVLHPLREREIDEVDVLGEPVQYST